MIPFEYFIALSLSLVIIVYGIIETFYPINREGNINLKKVLFFFLGFSWFLAVFDGTHPLVDFFAIICGLLTAYCYILFKEKKEIKETEENEIGPVSPEEYFGVKGQVYAIIEDENEPTKRYIGSILDSSYRIEFISNDQFEKYDYFQITGFENGHFIGEKITTL